MTVRDSAPDASRGLQPARRLEGLSSPIQVMRGVHSRTVVQESIDPSAVLRFAKEGHLPPFRAVHPVASKHSANPCHPLENWFTGSDVPLGEMCKLLLGKMLALQRKVACGSARKCFIRSRLRAAGSFPGRIAWLQRHRGVVACIRSVSCI